MDVDALVKIATDGGTLGILIFGMVLAYKWVTRSANDAISIYKTASSDSDRRLALERAAWAAERVRVDAEREREREAAERREAALLARIVALEVVRDETT